MIQPTQTKRTKPLYDPSKVKPAYHLRYSWTGWPSQRKFHEMPVQLLDNLKPIWETDGIKLLEHRWTDEKVQLLFSTKPSVSPVDLAARAKGRLDHAIRGAGLRMPLSRKLAVRSIGDNTREEVEAYIESQVGKQQFVDANFEAFLQQFTISNIDVDLSKPSESVRGRYWYNLHMVLVTAERFRIVDASRLATLRDWSIRIAKKKGYLISRLSVMPDHLHVALRGDHEESPNQLVFAFQNNLAYAVGMGRIWCDGFYVGTFSEYNMEAIRRKVNPR
jgi:REP element-mobilizing transposase RayT